MYLVSLAIVFLLLDNSLAEENSKDGRRFHHHGHGQEHAINVYHHYRRLSEPKGLDLNMMCLGDNCRRSPEGQFANIVDLMKLIQSIVYVHDEQKKASTGSDSNPAPGGDASKPDGGSSGSKPGEASGGKPGGAAGGKPGGAAGGKSGGAAGGKPGGGAGGKPGGGAGGKPGGAAGGKPGGAAGGKPGGAAGGKPGAKG